MALSNADKAVLAEVQSDLEAAASWNTGPKAAKLKAASAKLQALIDGEKASELLEGGQSPD